MSRTINGLQQFIREMSKYFYPYMHYSAHSLNLFLVGALKYVSAIHNTIGGILKAINEQQPSSSLQHNLYIES